MSQILPYETGLHVPNDLTTDNYANFSYQAKSWGRKRRVVAKVEWHPGELYPRVGFIVTNLSRPAKRVVAFYNHRGTAEQYIKEGKYAIKWTRLSLQQVPQQRGSPPTSCLGLQSRQLHANIGLARRGCALVADHVAGETGEDWGQSRPPWPLCHLPIGRGCHAGKFVRENTGSD